jgi:hypothetical protein
MFIDNNVCLSYRGRGRGSRGSAKPTGKTKVKEMDGAKGIKEDKGKIEDPRKMMLKKLAAMHRK